VSQQMPDQKQSVATPPAQPPRQTGGVMSLAQQLASENTAPVAELVNQPRTKSLLLELANAAGVSVKDFWPAVKVAAGCKGASDEHFLVLLMQAQKYGLDPLSSPPQLQLLDVGQGPQVYARLDAYKTFLHRAEAAGKVEWRKYEEGWFPDPAQPPEKQATARGGKVTMKLRNFPEPVTKIVWFREWGGKGQWATRGSHMLEARAWKEACRDFLGFFLYDEEDARITETGGGVKNADADVRDATPIAPVVPIHALGQTVSAFAPPPAPLGETIELDAEGKPDSTAGMPQAQAEGGVPQSQGQPSSGADAGPPASPPHAFDAEESARLDAEIAAEEAKKSGRLFS
jgi:hypothetical protein